MKLYGEELRKSVLEHRQRLIDAMDRRQERIDNCETDYDDCFISIHIEQDGIRACNMRVAKCYLKRGWWKHYRTEDGHTFSVRDDKDYWYDGNAFTNDKTNECYISKEKHEALFLQIKFEA